MARWLLDHEWASRDQRRLCFHRAYTVTAGRHDSGRRPRLRTCASTGPARQIIDTAFAEHVLFLGLREHVPNIRKVFLELTKRRSLVLLWVHIADEFLRWRRLDMVHDWGFGQGCSSDALSYHKDHLGHSFDASNEFLDVGQKGEA